MSTLNTIIPNFEQDYVTKWDRDSGDITLSAEGSLYYQQMKQLYYETEKYILVSLFIVVVQEMEKIGLLVNF